MSRGGLRHNNGPALDCFFPFPPDGRAYLVHGGWWVGDGGGWVEGFGSINGSMPSQGAGFWLIREVALMRPCWGKPFLAAPTRITCWVLRVRNAVRVTVNACHAGATTHLSFAASCYVATDCCHCHRQS